MKKTFTKFGPWFKAQFPLKQRSMGSRIRLHERAEAFASRAQVAEAVMHMADHAEAIRDAALKGWVAGFEAGKLEAKKEMKK